MIKKMKHSEDEAKKMKQAQEEAKKMHQAEEEAEEKKEAEGEESEEAEEEEAKQDGEPEEDPEHEDIAKDKELILSMIKKYMGDEEEEDGEQEAKIRAYQAHCEMGYDAEEAAQKTADAVKLAKKLASKEMKQAEKCEADESEVVPMTAKKEAEVAKLVARIAFLERELKKRDLTEALDKKLKESGFGRAETDKIRSLIGSPKSEAQIDETIKIFKEAFSVRGGETATKKGDFFVSMERTEKPAKSAKINFAG